MLDLTVPCPGSQPLPILLRFTNATKRFLSDRCVFFKRKTTSNLLVCLTIEKYTVFLTMALFASALTTWPTRPSHFGYSISTWDAIVTVLWWPLIETIVGQWAVIETIRRLKGSQQVQMIASIVVFVTAHYLGGGLGHALFSGVIGGYYLAFLYLLKRDRSVMAAFSTTLAFHVLHNSLTIAEHASRN